MPCAKNIFISIFRNFEFGCRKMSQHSSRKYSQQNSGSVSHNKNHGRNFSNSRAGLKGKEIGLYYAKKQREKNETMNKDMIEITVEQINEVEKVCGSILNSSQANLFGGIDYESDFMMAYQANLSLNAEKKNQMQDDWETLTDPEPMSMDDAECFKKESSSHINKLTDFRKKLPTYAMRDQIVKLSQENKVFLISGETGCGKTTQIPQYILDYCLENRSIRPRVVCTQPRRISGNVF